MQRRRFLTLAAAGLALPVAAPMARGQLVRKFAEDLGNGEYNWFPERSLSGPLLVIVSIPEQKVHVYRNGVRIAASSCSTGKPGHATPSGVFKILQKDKHHRSSTYSNAPMPNMNRLTWSGIALHAGNLPGYPASHGCVRLPMGFSELLFGVTKLGMTVVIADNNSDPQSVVHPSLVLGSYPRQKFDAVSAKISSVKANHDDAPHSHLVVSSKDRKATLYHDGTAVTRESVYISEPDRPLASQTYHLDGTDNGRGGLKWQAVSSGKGNREATLNELHRIRAKGAFAEEVHRRLHKGMVIVTTPEPHSAQNVTNRDFVVVDSLY